MELNTATHIGEQPTQTFMMEEIEQIFRPSDFCRAISVTITRNGDLRWNRPSNGYNSFITYGDVNKIPPQFDATKYLTAIETAEECIICYEQNAEQKISCCGAIFHLHCINEWCKLKKSCPHYRANLK